jgi:hypothetical protein
LEQSLKRDWAGWVVNAGFPDNLRYRLWEKWKRRQVAYWIPLLELGERDVELVFDLGTIVVGLDYVVPCKKHLVRTYDFMKYENQHG